MRASQRRDRRLCPRKDLNFPLAHRAKVRLTSLRDPISSSNRRSRQTNSNTNRDGTFQDAASVHIQQTASQEQSSVLWLGLHHDSDRSHHRHSARTVCPGSSGASTNRTHSAERGWPGGG